MKILDKIENLDIRKLFIISLISAICFAVSKITLLVLSFSIDSLFWLLLYLVINVLIVVFLKKGELNNAFLFFICGALADVVFNFFGFWSSANRLVNFVIMLALLGVLILYFVKNLKDLRLAYLLIGIFAYFSFYNIIDNFYWLFKFEENFYYNIINIILEFSFVLYYLVMISIISKPRTENNGELIVKFLKICAIVVVVFLCITMIGSCLSSSGDGEKCQYIDENGDKSCYRIATKGNLCKQHFNEIYGFYNDLENWWNSLS